MSTPFPEVRASRVPLPSLAALERSWRELESRSSDHLFFLSWEWIGLWLERLPKNVKRSLLQVESQGRVVGLAIVCERTQRRGGIVSKGLFINCTGHPELDELTVEYNDLLVEDGMREHALSAFIDCLGQDSSWDELFFDGWRHEALLRRIMAAREGQLLVRRQRPTHGADLQALRASGSAQLDTLPGRVRYKVRQSFKHAREIGAVRLEAATTAEETRAFLEGLYTLHQQAWIKRGMPGAFANDFLKRFHDELARRHPPGSVTQLLRLRIGEVAVAYLYNFIHQRRVYNYQSGFDFEFASGTAWRPGVLCHLEAIEFYKQAGMDTYDFMAGDQAYKKELGQPGDNLAWLTFQRPRIKFEVEAQMRSAWARLKVLRQPRTAMTIP